MGHVYTDMSSVSSWHVLSFIQRLTNNEIISLFLTSNKESKHSLHVGAL